MTDIAPNTCWHCTPAERAEGQRCADCVNWDGYYLEKHTRYFEDYPLAFVPSSPFNKTERVYSVTIEISEDLSIMYVNGEEVLSSFFDLEEIDRSGRIGLFRNWGEGEITFSNIQVKMPAGSTD